METRKVQLSGGTTYTVSLPKSWAQEHGIDAGSTLSLYPNGDGSLLVEADADRLTETRSTTVDVSTASDNAVRQWIHALHAVGFDTVVLVDRTGHSAERRDVIEDTVANLSGFELLKAGDTRIQLTNLIDAENVDVRKSALRLRLVILGMHRDAVSAVLTGDETLAQRVIDRDNEADKLFAMVTRHFRRALTNLHEVEKLEYSRDELFEYYYVARQCERIADHAEKTALLAAEQTDPPDAGFVADYDELSERAQTLVGNASSVVLGDAGTEMAYRSIPECDRLVADIEERERALYDGDTVSAYECGILLDSVKRTAEYGANIAELAIQRSMRGTDGDG